jgi:hypothetical protein
VKLLLTEHMWLRALLDPARLSPADAQLTVSTENAVMVN